MALTRLQENVIAFLIANPFMRDAEVCRQLNISANTMCRWKKKPEFTEALHKACQEKFKDAERVAIEGMIENAANGNVQAQKYMLDYMDYKPVEKVEQTVTTINVTVDEDEEAK